MRRNLIFAVILAVAGSAVSSLDAAAASCALPYTLTNGQTADATQVMANYNALLNCLNNIVPGGSTDAVQYNAGAGNFGGVGPLSNGQLAIGSTGGAPQAATLTAGGGIAITSGPGSVTISTAGSAFTPPALSAFTQLGDGTFNGSATQGNGYVQLDGGTAGGASLWLLTAGVVWTSGKTVTIEEWFTTPPIMQQYWTIRVAFSPNLTTYTDLIVAGVQTQFTGGNLPWFSVSTWGGAIANIGGFLGSGRIGVRIVLSGTTMASYVSLDSATAGSWTKLNSTTVPEGIVAGNTIYPGIWFGPQENSSGYDYQASWNSHVVTVQ